MASIIDAISDLYKHKSEVEDKELDRTHDITKLILSSELANERMENEYELRENSANREIVYNLYNKKLDTLNATIENIDKNYLGLGSEFKTAVGYNTVNDIMTNQKLDVEKLNTQVTSLSSLQAGLESYQSKLSDLWTEIPNIYSQHADLYAGPEGVLSYEEFNVMLEDLTAKAGADTTATDPLAALELSLPTTAVGPDGLMGTDDDVEGTRTVWGGDLLKKYYYDVVASNVQQQTEYERGSIKDLTTQPLIDAQSSYMELQSVFAIPDKVGTDKYIKETLGIDKEIYNLLQPLLSAGQSNPRGYQTFLDRLNDPDRFSSKVKDQIIKAITNSPALRTPWKSMLQYSEEVKSIEGGIDIHEGKDGLGDIDLDTITGSFLNTIENIDDQKLVFELLHNIFKTNPSVSGNKFAREQMLNLLSIKFPNNPDILQEYMQHVDPPTSYQMPSEIEFLDTGDYEGSASDIWDVLHSQKEINAGFFRDDFSDNEVKADALAALWTFSKLHPTFQPRTTGDVVPVGPSIHGKGAKSAILNTILSGSPSGQIVQLIKGKPGYSVWDQPRADYSAAMAIGSGFFGGDSPAYNSYEEKISEIHDAKVSELNPWFEFKYKWRTNAQKEAWLKNEYPDDYKNIWQPMALKAAKEGGIEYIKESLKDKDSRAYKDIFRALNIIKDYK